MQNAAVQSALRRATECTKIRLSRPQNLALDLPPMCPVINYSAPVVPRQWNFSGAATGDHVVFWRDFQRSVMGVTHERLFFPQQMLSDFPRHTSDLCRPTLSLNLRRATKVAQHFANEAVWLVNYSVYMSDSSCIHNGDGVVLCSRCVRREDIGQSNVW